MINLGRYKKIVFVAAAIQCIIVIVGGYLFFKYSVEKDSMKHEAQEKARVEQSSQQKN